MLSHKITSLECSKAKSKAKVAAVSRQETLLEARTMDAQLSLFFIEIQNFWACEDKLGR